MLRRHVHVLLRQYVYRRRRRVRRRVRRFRVHWGTTDTGHFLEHDYCCGNSSCSADPEQACGEFGDPLLCDTVGCDENTHTAWVGNICEIYHD
jgi:hypothetical protein